MRHQGSSRLQMGLWKGSEGSVCSRFPRASLYHGLPEQTAEATDAVANCTHLGEDGLGLLDVETRTEDVDFFKLCPKQDMAALDQPALCV